MNWSALFQGYFNIFKMCINRQECSTTPWWIYLHHLLHANSQLSTHDDFAKQLNHDQTPQNVPLGSKLCDRSFLKRSIKFLILKAMFAFPKKTSSDNIIISLVFAQDSQSHLFFRWDAHNNDLLTLQQIES